MNHLISCQKACEMFETTPHCFIIDIRKIEDYNLGHIKGARQLWRTAYQNKTAPFTSEIIPPQQLQALLETLGYQMNQTIYLYDSRASYDAAYVWWLLKCYGIDDVYIIDGGIDRWLYEALPLTTKTEVVTNTEIQPLKLDKTLLATYTEVKKALKQPSCVILDTRSIEEYSGEMIQVGAKKGGRIKGCTFIPFDQAIDRESGNIFKPMTMLKTIYQDIMANEAVITYCQAGFRSAHTLFVLYDLLGYKQVKNYAASWMEWSHYE